MSSSWQTIHAANPMGGEKTKANARAGLGRKAVSVSNEPYLTTAAPANAPTASVARNATVLAGEEGGSSAPRSVSGSALVALVALVALRAWRVLNGVYCELERAMRQPIVPKGDIFANIVRCMALVDENSITTIFQGFQGFKSFYDEFEQDRKSR